MCFAVCSIGKWLEDFMGSHHENKLGPCKHLKVSQIILYTIKHAQLPLTSEHI